MTKIAYGRCGDTMHEVVEGVRLKGGAKLHRFTNAGGVPYSAIYLGNVECWNDPRSEENRLVYDWNALYEENWLEDYRRFPPTVRAVEI